MNDINKKNTYERGNVALIILGLIAIVAIGGFAYFSSTMNKDDGAVEMAVNEDTSQNMAANAAEQEAEQGVQNEAQAIQIPEDFEIKPGNPVVAKVGDNEVTRVDVFKYIQTLPPATRQLPITQLFPLATEQVINAQIIGDNTNDVNLDNDPMVKEQLAQAKKNIVRTIYIQKQVEKRLDENRLKAAYEEYKANFPETQQIKAQHILVEDEKLAKDLTKQIKDGADFASIAKESSIDGTAASGGQLGYFAQTDVVPEFAEKAFSMKPGEITDKPVKTDFGYHIIKVEDKRIAPVPTYEEAKPFLEPQLRQVVLSELLEEWRNEKSIERFDINGEAIEPAAGDAPAE